MFDNHIKLGAGESTFQPVVPTSFRVRQDANTGVSWVTASGFNRRKFTASFWFKPTRLDYTTTNCLFGSKKTGTYPAAALELTASTGIRIRHWNYSGAVFLIDNYSDFRFIEEGVWTHYVLAVNTNNGTAADRYKLYINGERMLDADTNSSQFGANTQSYWGVSGYRMHLGGENTGSASPSDGYYADFHLCAGYEYAGTDFGQYNEYGVWIPKEFTGTYGALGAHLTFANTSNIGQDFSGNGNDWTTFGSPPENAITPDNPEQDFCTIQRWGREVTASVASGGLQYNARSDDAAYRTTLSTTGGKYYWEVYIRNTSDQNIGLITAESKDADESVGSLGMSLKPDGNIWTNETSSGAADAAVNGPTYTTGDVVMMAADLDNNLMWWGKNGQWYSANAATTNAISTSALEGGQFGLDFSGWGDTAARLYPATQAWMPYFGGDTTGGGLGAFNFGADSKFVEYLADASANTDATGVAEFKYTPPSGYLAWMSRNFNVTQNALDHFSTGRYTGNSSTKKITGLGFRPGFIIFKQTNSTGNWLIADELSDELNSPNSQLEIQSGGGYETGGFVGYDADGFTLKSDGDINGSGNTYIYWALRCNNANTATSLTTDVGTVNTYIKTADAGHFSIFRTQSGKKTFDEKIPHGLGATPEFLILKRVTLNSGEPSGFTWQMWHNADSAPGDDPKEWYDGIDITGYETAANTHIRAIDSETIHLGGNADVYSWMWGWAVRSVPGICKVGFYYGNGLTEGPYVNLGFRPGFILTKHPTSGAADMAVRYTARSGGNYYGATMEHMNFDSNAAEISDNAGNMFIHGNGFKIYGTTGARINVSGVRYNFVAFAEHPGGGIFGPNRAHRVIVDDGTG